MYTAGWVWCASCPAAVTNYLPTRQQNCETLDTVAKAGAEVAVAAAAERRALTPAATAAMAAPAAAAQEAAI